MQVIHQTGRKGRVIAKGNNQAGGFGKLVLGQEIPDLPDKCIVPARWFCEHFFRQSSFFPGRNAQC